MSVKDQREEMKESLKELIAKNMTELRDALGWNNKQFSSYLEISEPGMSNILNGVSLPGLEFFAVLCKLDAIKEQGFDFTLEDFLSESFNPKLAKENRKMHEDGLPSDELSTSFAGNYFCYFFDQAKPKKGQDEKADRDLRYGVISIHNTFDGIYGKQKNHVYAKFYKEDEYEKAVNEKNNLDELFSDSIRDTERRHKKIQEHFVSDDDIYYGELAFHGERAFIAIESGEFFDQALIILYSSSKKAKKPYCGGLGAVTSVAHGNNHMPTAQKILLSKYVLDNCPKEKIAQYLSMASVTIAPTSESIALGNLCKQMYNSNDELVSLMTDDDKISIISNRVSHLIQNYIDKNICCVASVSKDEDEKVYQLIQQAAKHAKGY